MRERHSNLRKPLPVTWGIDSGTIQCNLCNVAVSETVGVGQTYYD